LAGFAAFLAGAAFFAGFAAFFAGFAAFFAGFAAFFAGAAFLAGLVAFREMELLQGFCVSTNYFRPGLGPASQRLQEIPGS